LVRPDKTIIPKKQVGVQQNSSKFQEGSAKIQKAAQSSADNENFKSAIARLIKNLPIAGKKQREKNGNIGTFHKLHLHPPSLNLPNNSSKRVTRGSKLSRKKYISPKMVMQGLRGLNKGKVGCIQVDSLDLLSNWHVIQTKAKRKSPNLQIIRGKF